ncbi:MAG: hypothetical protein H8E40_01695 [Chloroflexi bacterium]|nr:hypothetical protein [Chloroflexota bacterium]
MAKQEYFELKNDGLVDAEMLDTDYPYKLITGSLPFGQLSVPRHIDIVGDNLYWYDDPFDDYKRDKANDTGALNAFVRIKTPDNILRFARRLGPLGLCKHGLPPMHRGTWYRDEYENGELVGVTHTGEWNPADGASERGWCPPCGPEPIKRWLEYSSLALSYLNLAASLKIDTGKRMRGLRQLFLQDRVNEWLGDAGIRLELNWSGNEPVLTLVGGGVFGALGVQLLSAVTRNTLAVCSGCGEPYLRKARKPKPGQRNFCPDCQSNGVPNRLGQRDWQRIKKESQK